MRTRTVSAAWPPAAHLRLLRWLVLQRQHQPQMRPRRNTPGTAAVGRPDLTNPAPALRAAQQFGDSVFSQTPGINKTLDESPLGTGYHEAFGQAGKVRYDQADGKYYYDKTTGSNGAFKGVLNTAPADQLGNVLLVRECNLKGDPASGAPVFGFKDC